MLIRSQDGKILTTDFNLSIQRHTSTGKFTVCNKTFGMLGIYTTEEQAVQVLDQICRHCELVKSGQARSVVFEMPQEDEV